MKRYLICSADAYLEMLSQVPNPQEYLRACPDERPIDFL